jgi:hypothetical protein
MARVEEVGRRGRGKSCPGLPPKKRILPVCHFAVHMLAKIFMKAAKPAARPKQQLTKVRTPTCPDVFQRTHQPQSGRSRHRLQLALRQPPICFGLRSPRGGAAPARSSGRGCRVRPVRVLVTRCSLVMGRGAGRTAAVLVHRQCVGRVLPVGSLCRLLHVLCLCVQLEGFSVGEEDCGMMGGNCGQRLFSTRPTRVSAVSH